MSKKCRDCKGRWRDITVGFRVSREESAAIDMMVALSGMTKQDYCLARLLDQEITVTRNPKAYIGLKREMQKVYEELKRLTDDIELSDELIDKIAVIADVYDRMKGENENGENK